MPPKGPSHIHPFYRIFFLNFDPIIALYGAYLDFFDPDKALDAVVPNASRILDHDMLFHQRGGGMLGWAFMSLVFLRYTQDVTAWKILQAAILIDDLAVIYSLWKAYEWQGRLHPSTWREEDWGYVGIIAFVTVVRTLFIAGVGIGKEATKAKAKATGKATAGVKEGGKKRRV